MPAIAILGANPYMRIAGRIAAFPMNGCQISCMRVRRPFQQERRLASLKRPSVGNRDFRASYDVGSVLGCAPWRTHPVRARASSKSSGAYDRTGTPGKAADPDWRPLGSP
jgi:hypothetical protein